MSSGLLVELPSYVAESCKVTIAEGNILQETNKVSPDQHPNRVLRADRYDDNWKPDFVHAQVASHKTPYR